MSFSSDLNKATKNATQSVEGAFRAKALRLFNAVIFRTPVDTGRARGNWQTAINDPIYQAIGIRPARDAMAEAIREATEAEIGDDIVMTNNLPYILELERGRSRQAPRGMVRLSLLEQADP